jgi:hypothetical protein
MNMHFSDAVRPTLVATATLMALAAGPAQAGAWVCTHGHSGTVEYPSNLVTEEGLHIGWGLDFALKPSKINWVHYAPAAVLGKKYATSDCSSPPGALTPWWTMCMFGT